MTDKDEQINKKPPKIPRKLDRFITETDIDQEDDFIVGDGDIELTSKHPVSLVEYFISSCRDEWAKSSFMDYSYDLTRFLEYCAYANIEDLSELSSRDLEGFKQWRKKDGNIVLATLHGQLANIRVFVRFCERLEIIDKGLAEEMDLPDLDNSDIVSYVRIMPEQAEDILSYHQKHDYAKRRHAEFALIWSVLCRLGDLRSLDLDNYSVDDEGQRYVEFEHSPAQGTPLKNGESEAEGLGGERKVNVPDWVAEILDDYIANERNEFIDEYDRQPLFTTGMGRVAKSTIRRDLYRITQPCRHGKACPYDLDPDDCEARNDTSRLSRCPSTVSPHPVRRGGICYQLREGVSKDLICEKADVSRKVLNKHYDIRTKEEARIQRREELKNHLDGYETKESTKGTEGHSYEISRKLGSFTENSPLAGDLLNVLSRGKDIVDQHRAPGDQGGRIVKGVAGYAAFLALCGLNLGLMGIGFNPLTMELVMNFW